MYVAAFVPDAGESAAGLGGASTRLREAIRPGPDGSTRLCPDLAAAALYDDCPEPLAARAVGLLRAQAPGCGRGVPQRQSWKDAPSAYVVCASGGRAIPRSWDGPGSSWASCGNCSHRPLSGAMGPYESAVP